MQPFLHGDAQARHQQLRAAHRLQLGAARRAARACTAATASTTTASRSRSSRSSAASTAARCRSRCAPATCSSSIRRPAAFPPFAPIDRESVHRLHPARRRRVGHQHHRQPTCRTRWCSSSTSASSAQLPRHVVLRVDGVHNLGTHFIIGRTVGTVFNPVVGGPDRVVNLESSVEHELRRAARRAPSGAARAHRLPRVLHAVEGAQLRQRRSDPVRERADRSEQPAPRVRPDAERSAAPLHVRGVGARCRAASSVAPIWTIASGVPMDILMPDAPVAHPGRSSATPAAALFKTGARAERRSSRAERQRRRRTACCCRWCATTRSFSDAFNSLDLRVSRPFAFGTVRGSSRWSKCSTCSTSRTSSGVEREELLGLRQRAGARQRRSGEPGLPALVELRPGR